MTNLDQIEELNQTRAKIVRESADARNTIELSEAMRRLHDNKDFKRIIDETYLRDEAERLVSLLADGSAMPERDEKDTVTQLYAVSHFKRFIGRIYSVKEMAEARIAQNDMELEEIDNQLTHISGGE